MGSFHKSIDNVMAIKLADRHKLMKTEACPVEGVVAATLYGLRDRMNLTF
jgi:hypothetical protein